MYKLVIKRFFDFLLALNLLLFFLPIFIVITLFLFFANNGKPFFFQSRPGKNEKVFRIMKFRTMNDKKDANNNLLPDADRLTEIGKFIRKTSLDEMPQLFNILKGEMSFIGPRPLLIKYLPYYTDLEKIRHSVRPGITGLAQVSGRNTLGWSPRLAKDAEYVQNLTFKQDFQIFIKTIESVLSAKDIVVDPRSILKDLDEERK